LCICTWLSGDRASGFSYFSYGGTPVIWWSYQADRYLSEISFQEGDDADTLIKAAMGQWSSVWGSGFQYAYGYVSENSTVLDPNDGYSMTVAVPANFLDPGVLGVTYMVSFGEEWYDMDLVFSDFPEGAGWHMLPDPDCEITNNPAPDNGFSFYLVALHELGHALGLGHDPIGDEPAGTAWRVGTMNPAYPAGGPIGNQNIIELHTDERRAMRFLYPDNPVSKMDLANSGYTAQGPRLGKAIPSFFTPSPITPGQQLTLWAMIENFGTMPASNVRDRFWLSTDIFIDPEDRVLGSLTFNVLSNARNEIGAATVIPDLPAGTYYIGSLLDDLNQVVEEYEDNNQADYCAPLIIAQAVPTFGSFSQHIITCDQAFTGPTPVVPYPVNMAPITWSIDNPPSGMTVNPTTGVISWPAPIKSPFIYEIVLRSTNGAGTSTQTLRLGVQQAAPRIQGIANHSTKCGADYVGPTPALTAPICMAPILGWSLMSGPPGMTINPSSGVVSWPDPVPGQGPYNVTIRAINDIGETNESWLLYVASANGDLDANGVVNLADANLFSPCLGGPHADPSGGCVCADFDQDDDVDLYDFARLTLAFSGASIRLGACCFGDGNCDTATPDYCYTLGGYYQGDGTSCSQVSCQGACCFFTGGCLNFTLDFCDIAGGTFQGMGSRCVDLSCPAANQGACCWPNETCTATTPTQCATGNGHFQGVGMSCNVVDCSAPVGACCQVDGACTVGTEVECAATAGTFMGNNSACSANLCDGACCYPSGTCLNLSVDACEVSAGVFEGPLTACGSFQCPVEAIGACCHTDDTCTEETASRCTVFGGSYQGDSSTCATSDCTIYGACCLPDESCAAITPVACQLQNGVYTRDGWACRSIDCSLDEVGACYDPLDWSCQVLGSGICRVLGRSFEGAGTTCTNTRAPEYSNTILEAATYFTPGANSSVADDMRLSGTARGLIYYSLAVAGSGGGTYSVNAALYTDCPGEGGTLIPGTQQTWTGVPADGLVYTVSTDFLAPIRLPDTVWMSVSFSSPNAGWIVADRAEIGSTDDLYGQDDPPWVCDYWFGGPPNDYAGFWAEIQCLDIPEPQGPCCLSNGGCSFGTILDCNTSGGLFMGEDLTCTDVDCSNITVGACCDTLTWTCTLMTEAECAAADGSFDGVGTSCTNACPEYRNDIDPVTLSYNPGRPMADDIQLAGTARDLSFFNVAVYGGGGGPFSMSVAFYDKSPCSGGVVIPGTLVTGNNLPDGQLLDLNVTLPAPVHLPANPWVVMEFSTAYAGWIVAENAEVGTTNNVFALAQFNGTQWTWTCNNTVPEAHAGFWLSAQCIDAGALLRAAPGEPVLEVKPIATPVDSVRLMFKPSGSAASVGAMVAPASAAQVRRAAAGDRALQRAAGPVRRSTPGAQ
jgi:hypothetical protein